MTGPGGAPPGDAAPEPAAPQPFGGAKFGLAQARQPRPPGDGTPAAPQTIDFDELRLRHAQAAEAANGQEGTPRRPAGPSRLVHWGAVGDGMLVALVVCGPIVLIEGDWHGSPLTHQPDGLWVVALLTASAGMFLGAALAGRHRRLAARAALQGVVMALLCDAVLAVAALSGTVVRHGHLSGAGLASAAGLVVWSLLVAVAGALTGRRRYLRLRSRKAR